MPAPQRKCLYCYEPLQSENGDYHARCSLKFFGSKTPPDIEFGKKDIQELAVKVLSKSIALTGVQPKLSLEMEPSQIDRQKKRFTIVGLWGNFILKPPMDEYWQMPEIEDLTMHLSELLEIKTAEHTLVRLSSGELAYISKRFDRTQSGKLQLEDMAQLTATLTERKYKSSMEKVGKTILKYSNYPKFDLLTFFELTIFSFLTGNADMHLKNFSLLTNEDNEVLLSPAYDLLSTKLLIPKDTEEMALTLNGKKSNLNRNDFDMFAEKLQINSTSVNNTYRKFFAAEPVLLDFIDKSFLEPELKDAYRQLFSERLKRLKTK